MQQGFSLIEALAALAILSLGLGSLYSAFGNALHAARRIDDHVAMTQLAQSLLERTTVARTLQHGVTSGREAGLDWTLEIAPADAEMAPQGNWAMQRVVAVVRSRSGAKTRLETLHLARLETLGRAR